MISQSEKLQTGRLTWQPPETDVPEMEVRVQAMRRALDNLIGNALRYADFAEIRLKVRDDNLYIFIDDNGPGIAYERRADALRPFVGWKDHVISRPVEQVLDWPSPMILSLAMEVS